MTYIDDLGKKIESLVDDRTALIFIRDTDLEILWVNKEYCDFYDLPKRSIIGRTQEDIVGHRAAKWTAVDKAVVVTEEPLVVREVGVNGQTGEEQIFISAKVLTHTHDSKFLVSVAIPLHDERSYFLEETIARLKAQSLRWLA